MLTKKFIKDTGITEGKNGKIRWNLKRLQIVREWREKNQLVEILTDCHNGCGYTTEFRKVAGDYFYNCPVCGKRSFVNEPTGRGIMGF